MHADQPSIPGDRRGPAAGRRQHREPVIEVRPERQPLRTDVGAVLEFGERLVQLRLRVLPCAEAAFTNLLPPAVVAADVEHEAPRASRSFDTSGSTREGILRSACRENALVPSTVV